MKTKMNYILAIILVLITALPLGGCSGKSNDGESKASVQSVAATGDIIKAELPSGWCLVSGTEMTGAKLDDFICHSEKYEFGDPYLQISKDDRDIAAVQATLEAEDTFGSYLGPKELENGTWYIAENAAAATVGDKVCLVRGYECDFSSDEVQKILAKLSWI